MPRVSRESIRILHVDDDDDFAKMSALSLQRAGFTQPVTHCPDGVRALHYFATVDQQLAPDVVILDLQMPGMSGLEVLNRLRKTYKEQKIAIYLLTSSEDPAHQSQARAYGVTDYLLKKPYFHELIAKLDSLIELSNQSPG